MSVPSAVPRTAPIAIAPKPPPRFPPSRQGSINYSDSFSGFRSGINTPDTDSLSGQLAATPCESCLRRRLECVMSDDEENCVACQTNGAECSLGESPPPRKRKLNSDAEESSSKRSSPGRSDNISRKRRPNPPSLSSTVATSSSLIEEMANFGGPTLLKRTLGLQSDRYSQYIGPTTDFEPSLINLSPFDPHDESLLARGTLRKVSDDDTFLMLPDSLTPGHAHITEDVDEIESVVAPHGRKLIDLYFRIVHPGFPIIQKSVFYEKYDRSHREFSPPLLAAIYILAINWWDHSEELASLPRPNVRELERLVRVTLADAMYRPKLSTIQAGLLLSQRPEGDQWAPTAQLVAIGQELGLHLDCSSWKIPPWERGLRKRLAWALYMQDKWGALVHGRPSHIFSSNWAVPILTPHDFPDVEWEESDAEERIETERGRTLFCQMVQLSQILAEILETFYTLQATQAVAHAGAQGTQLVLSLAKPIQLKLKEWYSGLPASVRMDSTFQSATMSQSNNNRLSSIGYLHLAYFATEITLHRRIIRSIDASSSSSSGSTIASLSASVNSTTSSTAGSNASNIDPYIQHICRSAAKARLISAMDFVNRLTPSHLRAFWYFASKTNFALIGTFGSLLWATSPGREEADWYRRRLGEYRWTLSVSSKPGEGHKGLTEFAMGMLDISTGLLKKLPEKPLLSRSGSAVNVGVGVNAEVMRSQSLLALGTGTGSVPKGGFGVGSPGSSGFGRVSSMSGFNESYVRGGPDRRYQQPASGDASGVHSPRSMGSESSDEGVYGNFSATAGMAGLAD
ncbi:fungal-specific transcription factor domain-containing protein [Sordaria brevicollis]|uniref:Fungal-specific transcription factor domain-containing protein n=1 Tax=Sordaria brevicollis TaxID=83679 RepID=A0AAE0PKK1_SORBR|nr:fungal-specific transcription factor domain-containing protein [Sordaria brevicollis]